MNKEHWRISWSQVYTAWPKPKTSEYIEPEITDFTQAREVIARIMAL